MSRLLIFDILGPLSLVKTRKKTGVERVRFPLSDPPAPPCLNPGVGQYIPHFHPIELREIRENGFSRITKCVRSQGNGGVDARRGHCNLEFGIPDPSLNIDPTLLNGYIFTKMVR
jgi:hypothetical protein